MSCTKECPICMDAICGDKNCVTTDCGHNFHASCLFKNMAHNGFGCPYCRTELAHVPQEEDDDSADEDDDEWIDDEDDEPYFNRSLRRVREMFQEDYNAADEDDEDEEDEDDGYFHGEEEYENAPTSQLMATKLMEKGITYHQLVESLCSSNLDEYRFKTEYNETADKIYGKMRGILANHVQAQTQQQTQMQNTPPVHVPMER